MLHKIQDCGLKRHLIPIIFFLFRMNLNLCYCYFLYTKRSPKIDKKGNIKHFKDRIIISNSITYFKSVTFLLFPTVFKPYPSWAQGVSKLSYSYRSILQIYFPHFLSSKKLPNLGFSFQKIERISNDYSLIVF